MNEVWKPIEGTDGKYEVSNHGRVRSNNYLGHGEQQVLALSPDKKGYLRVRVYKGSYRATCKVHRLVAEAFIPNDNCLPQVNHKDGNKQNNHYDNLEWVTNADNHAHKVSMGLDKNFIKAREAASERRKKPVIVFNPTTGEKYRFNSAEEAKVTLNMRNISEVLYGRRKSSNGYMAIFAHEGVVLPYGTRSYQETAQLY